MDEEWKVIEEFPTYSVSNKGRIRNDIRDYILTGGYDRDGYRQVTICYDHKQYNKRICRLVAKAFIPNPNNYPVVNHKDECKDNDNVNNLEWCTVKYNNNYGHCRDKNKKPVKCIETNIIYKGLREAERQTNIQHSNISKSCRFNTIAGGFHWTYV